MDKTRLERFLDVIQKHRGVRVYGSDSRAEFDFSIVYELLNLEDYIQELELKCFDLANKLGCAEVKIKYPEFGKKKCKIKK